MHEATTPRNCQRAAAHGEGTLEGGGRWPHLQAGLGRKPGPWSLARRWVTGQQLTTAAGASSSDGWGGSGIRPGKGPSSPRSAGARVLQRVHTRQEGCGQTRPAPARQPPGLFPEGRAGFLRAVRRGSPPRAPVSPLAPLGNSFSFPYASEHLLRRLWSWPLTLGNMGVGSCTPPWTPRRTPRRRARATWQ